MVLKELGGWETLEMVQKYAHLASTHLAHYAARSEIKNAELWAEKGRTDEADNKKAA